MGQSAGAGPTPSGGNNSSGGFGRFNMAAIQPSPGGFSRGPEPAVVRPNTTSGQIGAASSPRAPANANLLDPQTLQNQATAMGRSMSGTPFRGRPDPSAIFTRPGAPMSLSGNAGPRPFMAQPPMYAMSTPSLSAPMYGRQSPMPSSFGSRLSALRGGMFGMPSNAVRFAEGGSTARAQTTQDLGRARPSHVYQPTYQNFGAPVQAAREAAGLGATPQYAQYQMQMPTFDRPSRGGDTRLQRPVPAGGMFKKAPATDPNFAIINQAFAPPQVQYDSEGTTYKAPVYMDQSQRNAILANPGAYLEYAQYVQGGGDPSKFVRQPQPISMMSKTQQDALIKKQKSELDRLLPQARVEEYSGGA